ncbi:DUF3566 domain-containing protein [Streptomyces orinoci]|uniref:DUF3566 domain-containing protein n=2 Tax=Streptomyces orinoci TaxID=67339 RepID=A0ABV3K276_STRON|nr:DUF3566 domain-containing protein [Streptomyces orinoci]
MTDTREPYHPPKAYEPPAEAAKAAGGNGAKKGTGAAAKAAAPAGKTTAGAKTGAKAAVPPQQAERPVRETAGRPAPAADGPGPRTRSARLRVAKADPWSVMKVSFLLSVALGVCTIVAVGVLWLVLDAMGIFSAVGSTISDATSGEGGGFDLQSFLSLPRVLMFTVIIAVIEVVLATALATLAAFAYNLSASFVGGVELTLAEDD